MSKWLAGVLFVMLALPGSAGAMNVWVEKDHIQNVQKLGYSECGDQTSQVKVNVQVPRNARVVSAWLTPEPGQVRWSQDGRRVQYEISLPYPCDYGRSERSTYTGSSHVVYKVKHKLRMQRRDVLDVDKALMGRVSESWAYTDRNNITYYYCQVRKSGVRAECRSKWFIGDSIYETRSFYKMNMIRNRTALKLDITMRVRHTDGYCHAVKKRGCVNRSTIRRSSVRRIPGF